MPKLCNIIFSVLFYQLWQWPRLNGNRKSFEKKRRQEKTVERPKRCIIHVFSGADNSTISAFTEQWWKVSCILLQQVHFSLTDTITGNCNVG